MTNLEVIPQTEPAYTLPLDQPLPKYSSYEEMMGGITHQQYFNSYLERRSAYFQGALDRYETPTKKAFHEQLIAEMEDGPKSQMQVLAKVSWIIDGVLGNDKIPTRRYKSAWDKAVPVALTAEGAEAVMAGLKRARKNSPIVTRERQAIKERAETIGMFVMMNEFVIKDPRSGAVIDPTTLNTL